MEDDTRKKEKDWKRCEREKGKEGRTERREETREKNIGTKFKKKKEWKMIHKKEKNWKRCEK